VYSAFCGSRAAALRDKCAQVPRIRAFPWFDCFFWGKRIGHLISASKFIRNPIPPFFLRVFRVVRGLNCWSRVITSFQPSSGLDGRMHGAPGVETTGYCRAVPPGQIRQEQFVKTTGQVRWRKHRRKCAFTCALRISLRPGGIASRMDSILARQNSLRLDGDSPIPLHSLAKRSSGLRGSRSVKPKSRSPALTINQYRGWQGNRLWNQGSDFGFRTFEFRNSDFGFGSGSAKLGISGFGFRSSPCSALRETTKVGG
jgi:hypothetical protein